MNFLAPLFLAGAAAVALPILFHLVRRTTRERQTFSSLLFLSQTPPRVTRRNRIEDLLLLLLRCLALLLLAAGFARPFLRDSAMADLTSRPPERVLYLLDVSASMRRAGLWEAARSRAESLVRSAAPTDEVSVWAFDHQARPLLTFAEWAATAAGDRAGLVTARLRETTPGWMGTRLDDALASAAESVAENPSGTQRGRQRVVVITDLQEGARLERLSAFDWPKGLELAAEIVKPRKPGNAGLQWVAETTESASATQAVVRVRVVNAPDSTVGRFEVGWRQPGGDGFVARAEEVAVPPGQSRVVALPVPAASGVERVMLRGDDEPFDNEIHVVPPSFQGIDALYLGADIAEADAKGPLYFLRKALPAAGRLGVRLAVAPADAVPEPAKLAAAKLLVATDALSADAARAVQGAVEAGRTLLFAPRSAAAAGTLALLLGVPELPVREASLRNYAILSTVDTTHPVLSIFGDPRFGDFTKIHFWKHRVVDVAGVPGARVMARYDSGEAAWVEVPVGRGHVIVLTSGWQPAESQFGLSTKFVPFLCAVLEYAGGFSDTARPWSVGDVLPVASGAGPRVVRLPSGERTELAESVTAFSSTSAPGIYEIEGAGRVVRHAVNLEGAESRTAPGSTEALEAMGAPVRVGGQAEAKPDPEKRQQLAAVESESRQKLWRWLIAATLVILLVESGLAAWSSRRLQQEGEVVP